jgi:hypothetical protein
MGAACNRHGRDEKCVKYFCLKALGRIILKLIVKERVVTALTSIPLVQKGYW